MHVCKLPPLKSHLDSWNEWQFTCQCQRLLQTPFDNLYKLISQKTNELVFLLRRRIPLFSSVSRKRENECPFVLNGCPMSRLIVFWTSLIATYTLAGWA